MLTNLMIMIYILQLIYNIYMAIIIFYYTFEYIQFDSSKHARLTVLTNYWKIKMIDDCPTIYRGKKCLGTLEYQSIHGLRRKIKVDKWYEIDCLFGFYREIEPVVEIREKPTLDMFILGGKKGIAFGLFAMIACAFLEFVIPYLDKITNGNIFFQRLGIIIVPLFYISYYISAIVMNHIDKKNKKKIKLKIKYDTIDSRLEMIGHYDTITEAIQSEHEKYIVKTDDDNEAHPGFLLFDEYGEYPITVYEKTSLSRVGMFIKALHLITLPLKGLYVLIAKRYKADWYKRIRVHDSKIMIMKEVKKNETIYIYEKEAYYDEKIDKYYPMRIQVKDCETLKEEFRLNIENVRYGYYEYISQVLSMPIFFIVLTIYELINNNMRVYLGVIVLILFAIITFVLGIPHIKEEYQRMLKIEEKLKKVEFLETQLFMFDITKDVRVTYVNYVNLQCNDMDIYKRICEDYKTVIDTDEEPLFWYALAYVQWENGKLMDTVKNNTLEWIKQEGGISLCSNKEKWLEALVELEKAIVVPTVKRKEIVVSGLTSNHPWNIGDIYTYHFHTKEAKNKGLYNKYILFQKVGDIKYGLDEIYSVIQVYDGIFEDIPSLDVINNLRILPLVYSPGDHGMPENIEDYFPPFDHSLKTMMITDKKNRYPLEWFDYVGNSYVEEAEYKLNEIEYYYWNEDSMEDWLMNYYFSWLGKEY